MSTYQKRPSNSTHRKIYKNHHGSIPTDENGRSYDIHHIDGNPYNNDINNLLAVSIQEHYNIHYYQQDWGACIMIAARMSLDVEKKSELCRKAVKQRIENGNWHFTSEYAKTRSQDQKNNGTMYWLSDKHSEESRKAQNKLVEMGTHNFVGANNPIHERIKNGIQPLFDNKILLATGKHASQNRKSCPHCGTTMDSANYAKHHGDNCHVIKQKIPLSANPNYVNSQAKRWKIVDTLTEDVKYVMGLNSWSKQNGFNCKTVRWSVLRHNKYKHFIITLVN